MVESLTRQSKIRSYWVAPGKDDNVNITPETLKEAICRVFGTEPDKLQVKGRDETTADAKHFYRWFLSKYYDMSDPSIAMLSNCGRSNVSLSIKRATELMEVDRSFQNKAGQIIDKWEAGLINLIQDKPRLEDVICAEFGVNTKDLTRHLGKTSKGIRAKRCFEYILHSLFSRKQLVMIKDNNESAVRRSKKVSMELYKSDSSFRDICDKLLIRVKNKELTINKYPYMNNIINQNNLNKAQQIREQYEKYYPNK